MEIRFKKELENFLEKYKPVKYKKNELIRQPGDVLDTAIYVKSGYLRVYTICKSGQEVTVDIHRQGLFLPSFLYLKTVPTRYYLEAMTPVEVYKVPKKEIIDFLVGNCDLFLEVIDGVMATFKRMLSRVEYLASGDAYMRVAATLVSLARNVVEKKEKSGPLDMTVSHRIIASMTGLTRETVTLQMLKLRKKGFISGKGKSLIINDISALEEELNCLTLEEGLASS